MIEEAIADKKGPGRPKSQSTPVLKKGKTSWKPASVVDVIDKDPNKRYRLVNKDPDNMAKKRAEGWEIESKVTSGNAELKHDGSMSVGSQMTSTFERKDVILMSMPEEIAKERDAYFEGKTRRQTEGLTSHFKKEMVKEGKAPTHGEITISSLRNTQVIK